MAASRFTPSASVANQIRKTSLGVNTGGSTGRLATVHKGVGLNPASGGLNTSGSGAAPMPGRASGAAPTALGNRTFTPGPALDPYRRVVRNGQSVLVRSSRLTAADRAGIAARARGGVGSPAGTSGTQPASTPASTTGSASPAPGPLDYRQQEGYISGMADIDYNYGNQRADLQDQLATNTREYGKQTAAAKDDYTRALAGDTDNLNHGGLLRSGAHEIANADRFKSSNDVLSHIEEQYGASASLRVNQALERLNAQEDEQRRAVEAGARDSYGQSNDAAPEMDSAAPAPASTPTAAAPAVSYNTAKYLRQRVPNGKGGWRVQSVLRSRLTPAQLKAALASDLNR